MIARVFGALLLVSTSALAQEPQLPPRDVPATRNSTGTGAITGVVRAADTGQPLRGADIRLTGSDVREGARGAFTDANGVYEFTGLPDGQYTLVASKVRYMTMAYGQTRAGEDGRTVEVKGGQSTRNVDFAMPAGGVIVLRVDDRFGDPAVGYRIELFQEKFGNRGQRTLARVSGASVFGDTTNDRGEIRLSGLPPGDYYVSAALGPVPPSAAGAPREQEVPTFYPGTAAEADAQPITVGLGAEVVVAFNTVVARLSRISGSVVGDARADRMQVERRSAAGATLTDMLLSVAPDGTFSRANLAPGEYIFTARNAKEFGTVTVELGDEDVSGVVLTMKPAIPISGRITFDGAPPVGVAPTAFVLRPTLPDGGITMIAQHKGDWTFEIPPARGSGVLRLEPTRGWFLKAVRLDGRDVTDTVLEFQAYQGKSVEIVLTQVASEIAGRAVSAAGQPVANYVAVAFPEDSRQWTPLSRAIVSARPDQQGRFSIRGLPPGRYLVAAVDYLPSGRERDPKTLERLRPRATAVALSEGGAQSVTITVAP